ncbi:MAG TPA: VanW family protein [Candidatus Ornithomonoglobus intestinigallinarum]|uniref:VanW family protein n=1 Tax=Candidatus Ornithomonoglobus intestinigallinarum TaxID=2840894 RepID=A0A9D1H4V0_9FIRM|nr:VanW family protein [Candidatus Ornithomonoglobus intestinigallinarum]
MAEQNTPNTDTNMTFSDAPTIFGKDAKEIISEVAENVSAESVPQDAAGPENGGDTQKIDTAAIKAAAAGISQNEDNDLPGNGEDSASDGLDDDFPPVTFSREDVLGTEDDEVNPYLDDAPAPPVYDDGKDGKKKKNTAFARSAASFFKKARKPAIISAAAAAGIFVVLYIISAATLPSDVIAGNVYIETLNVGGMTYDEALNAINGTYLFEDQTVTLKNGDETFEINGADIGLSASPEETAKKAFNYAKSGNSFSDTLKGIKLLFGRHTVVPVANIDRAKLDEQLWQFGVKVHGELVGHYVEVRDNNEATIWPGHTGFNNDVTKAREDVLNAFANERFTDIPVTLETAPPADITVEQYDLAVYKDPVDAYYEVNGDEVTVVPEQNGRYINKEQVAPMLAAVKEGAEPVIVPWETSYAAVTADELQSKLFSDTLASYSTYYGSSTANRSANVSRAAELMNGAVIPSGGIFSFNDRVGKRTTYNGFYTAPEYVNGETVQGIGGGTCQVSTTLYCSVLYAGLDIVSRTNHMFTVSYAPLGQDATVADDGVDFQFSNNTDYPIKISSYTDGSSIYVDIIGTAWEPAREVKLDHSVSYSSGGTYVYSKRYIYENGECIVDEELPSSYYKAH